MYQFTMVLGIDGSNLRSGGGVAHISQLLAHATLEESGLRKILLWGGSALLEAVPDRIGLDKIHVPDLDRGLPWRLVWQYFKLPFLLRRAQCDFLFAPGGLVSPGCRVPFLVVSQNLLPFDKPERRRFPFLSLERLRLFLLRTEQTRALRSARGVIFLSRYAQNKVQEAVGFTPKNAVVIPHGIEKRFFRAPAESTLAFSASRPFRLLYVSTVYYYKHQWNVAEAVANLRAKGLEIEIEFVGGGYPPAQTRLINTLKRVDPRGKFSKYSSGKPFEALHETYHGADAFVFASSCETIALVLIEAMASGLPIAASNRGPVPEVVKTAGIYFEPEVVATIESAIEMLYGSVSLRNSLAKKGFHQASGYSWEKCAGDTFSHLKQVSAYPL